MCKDLNAALTVEKQQNQDALTFLFLPGLLLCQVGQEVQRGLGLGRGDGGALRLAA